MLGTETQRYLCRWSLIGCVQSAIHHRLGWTKNAHFLEQFRYIIVASQLLSDHSNPSSYQRQSLPRPAASTKHLEREQLFAASPLGLSLTAATAFLLAWSIRWLHCKWWSDYSIPGVLLLGLAFAATSTIIYAYIRRQYLHSLRLQAIESASVLTINMQEFDATASAGLTLIQEVELISRGYNM